MQYKQYNKNIKYLMKCKHFCEILSCMKDIFLSSITMYKGNYVQGQSNIEKIKIDMGDIASFISVAFEK